MLFVAIAIFNKAKIPLRLVHWIANAGLHGKTQTSHPEFAHGLLHRKSPLSGGPLNTSVNHVNLDLRDSPRR